MNQLISQESDISEEFLMTLLCEVGQAKSSFMHAMFEARQSNFSESMTLLGQGDEALANVHKSQTSLIGFDEGEGKVRMTLILTHIQDHIMTTMLCRDLAVEIIELRKEMKGVTS
ncbi:PTS lactose/cellobiose transporter subunit IIA [Vibrio genomosp. F10]|uniref:PTS lactose/cellobiose transporter subunit IIA n=1 Tax=Vibrio genomosp. F10 TaxID=723171 RepID=UPI000316637D|nr:PTS lactose/cellobiose transporter subunit IIA [Vibrio genomosp. F10]OEF07745.1 PTS fructose transporter subunit IIC [Vibrio genomosp. F10 str. 9ZB36]